MSLPPGVGWATQANVPDPLVFNTYPSVPPDICKLLTAPRVTFAVVVKSTTPVALLTVNPDKEPTDVMFGCAFVYTVPATNALPTWPETLLPATELAIFAK